MNKTIKHTTNVMNESECAACGLLSLSMLIALDLHMAVTAAQTEFRKKTAYIWSIHIVYMRVSSVIWFSSLATDKFNTRNVVVVSSRIYWYWLDVPTLIVADLRCRLTEREIHQQPRFDLFTDKKKQRFFKQTISELFLHVYSSNIKQSLKTNHTKNRTSKNIIN